MATVTDIYIALEDEYYLVRYTSNHSHSTDFQVWPVYWVTPPSGEPLFGEIGATRANNPDDLPAFIAGSVKWDGCSDIEFPEYEKESCALHNCSRFGLTSMGVLLGRIWDQCIVLCPNSDTGVTGEPNAIVDDSPFPWEAVH